MHLPRHRWFAICLSWCAAASAVHSRPCCAQQSKATAVVAPVPGVGSPTPRLPYQGEVPTLERIVQLARERAPEIVAARAAVEESRAATVGARVSPVLNPYLEVIAERGSRNVTQDVYVTAQLHTPVEVAGQRGRRIAAADAFVEWHELTLTQRRARIAGAAVRAYGECVAWTSRYETLAELLASAGTEAGVMRARRDAGDATERDAQLAELERARIAVQLEETKASLGAALSELARLTGQRFGTPATKHLFPPVQLTAPPSSYAQAAPVVQMAEAESRFHARSEQRLARDGVPPMSVILQGGRGDYGETRLGAGLAWTFPTFRYNQGERALARAASSRARVEAMAYRTSIAQRLAAIEEEGIHLRAAVERLDHEAIPAAALATESATSMQIAGKTDLLSVVVARRDLYVLRLRRLEIAERAWALLGEWVELTGKMPQ